MRPSSSLALTLALSTALLAGCGGAEETTACGDAGGSTMCPGSDCLSCHAFKAAGTVFAGAGSSTPVGGASVRIVPASGSAVTVSTNSAGNFYTSAALAFPLQSVTVTKGADSVQMTDVSAGGCNGCHDPGFRIHLP